MNSRENILAAVLKNQPPFSPLPDKILFGAKVQDVVQHYINTFISIGGKIFTVNETSDVEKLVGDQFDINKRIVTTLPELAKNFELHSLTAEPHTYEDVEVAIIKAQLAVAENGAVWLTEQLMGQRIIPFICQHLVVVVDAETIVPTMHEAYEQIGEGQYGFGAFIGGPSKTADIEQALVMGAHGPISMTVFVVNREA